MNTNRNLGREAGLIYLLLAIFAPFRLLYIPSKLFVRGDAAATAGNIATHETMFRLGIVSNLICGVILIFLVLALYRLFKDVSVYQSVLLVIAGGVLPATLDFVFAMMDSAALILVRGADFLNVFDQAQREALALLFLRVHGQGILAAEILWGLWLFPMGALVYRSGFLPRFLGVWLVINGIAYLAASLTGLLWPQYETLVGNITFPALMGEIALVLWLIIKGARPPVRE